MAETDGNLLTPRQVGEILGATANTINTWAKLGKLPAVQLPNGRYRFRRSDINELLGRTNPCLSEQ